MLLLLKKAYLLKEIYLLMLRFKLIKINMFRKELMSRLLC